MQQDSEDFRFAAVVVDMLAKIDAQVKSEVKFKIYQILYEAGQKTPPITDHVFTETVALTIVFRKEYF